MDKKSIDEPVILVYPDCLIQTIHKALTTHTAIKEGVSYWLL